MSKKNCEIEEYIIVPDIRVTCLIMKYIEKCKSYIENSGLNLSDFSTRLRTVM